MADELMECVVDAEIELESEADDDMLPNAEPLTDAALDTEADVRAEEL